MENRRYRPSVLQLLGPYLFAILTTTLATGLFYLLRDVLDSTVIALLYLIPVGMSTVLWGLGPGISAALLSFVVINYFFIEPYNSLFVHKTQDLLGLLIFLGVAVGISQLVGRVRKSLDLATAREREAIRLYELSNNLAGVQDEKTIVSLLIEHIMEAFQTQRAEVLIEAGSDWQPLLLSEESRTPGKMRLEPDLLIPLQTARYFLGELRLWRQSPSFSPEEERMIRAFANQGVLALERAQLIQAATRTRVFEESDRLKSSILSSVSHELRSPLAAIKAAVSSLRSGAVERDSEAGSELLEVIEEDTDHLNQLVSNLLNMSRIEAGPLQLQRRWNVLAEIVYGVVRRMRAQAKEHTIEIDLPADLPLVPVDYEMMEQVFMNLLSNSFKYSPKNSAVSIQARRQDGQILLVRVKNQGPWVPEEHLDRIFDKFYRVTYADRIAGTGLGLSICKGIIEAHGGRIWAENLPDGFAFNFSLPLTFEGALPRINIE
jgi:two-component system, OmpR family, sensor histidine kinase KdpD